MIGDRSYSIITKRNLIIVFLVWPPLLRVFMLWRLLDAGFNPDITIYDKLIPLLFIFGSILLVNEAEVNWVNSLLYKVIVTFMSIALYAGILLGLTKSSDLLSSLVIHNYYLALGFFFAIALQIFPKRKY